MGYLVDTSPTLSFEDSKGVHDYIKKHGIIQFLNLYKKFKDTTQENIYWGDEIEMHLLNMNREKKAVKLQLNNEYMFSNHSSELFDIQPESGAWMLETVPIKPYSFSGDPTEIHENISARRKVISPLCQKGDILFQGTVFPLFRVGDFYIPKQKSSEGEEVLEIPEEDKDPRHALVASQNIASQTSKLMNPHPRYPALNENTVARRGENLSILVPIYKDENTSLEETKEEPHSGSIFMNEMLYGTGNTSIQYTFGAKNIDDARYLTDQMHVFSSIMLPLSAASPIFKGKLSDVDVRWSVLCHSCDSRTAEERDPTNSKYCPKSRWSTVSRYISNRPQFKKEYNDIDCIVDPDMMKFAQEKAKEMDLELDDQLLHHLGFLFVQDPLVVYADKIYVDDAKTTNHFENIQSTNWNNIRFKPPPSMDSEVGWRVELRTVECQLTTEENVAYGMLSYFFALMVMKREYNFYIPISKVDENMERGQKRDAALKEKFWFRKNIEKDSQDEYEELTIDEILNGKSGSFIGLFNLIYKFCLEEYGIDMQAEWANKKKDKRLKIDKLTENMKFFEILNKRAKGDIPTIASWARSFVQKHPKYKKDSIVSSEIAFDLIEAMMAVSEGQKTYNDFL